jgi:hypothetical protein
MKLRKKRYIQDELKMRKEIIPQGISCLAIAMMFVLTVLVLPGYAVGTGDIFGTVTDSNGVVEGADVNIYDADGFPVDFATTNAQGTYSITSLSVGEYKILFSKTGYIDQWYNNAPKPDCAEPVIVTDGGTATADAVLVLGGNKASQRKIVSTQVAPLNTIGISGSVTLNSNALKCAKVEAYSATDSSDWVDQVYTDYQGNYTLSNITSGSYKILFYDQNDTPSQWYNGTAGFSCATAVSETASGIDAAFPVGNLQQCTSLTPVINLLLK